MAKMLLAICAFLVFPAIAKNVKGTDSTSVIQKVIEMLQDNKVKIAADLAAEETEFAAYSQYCDDEQGARAYAIKSATRTITDLSAEILDCKAQTTAADDSIASLGTEIASKDQDLSSANAQRATAKADFEVVEKQLVTSVDQLEKAVVLMKRGAAAFLQEKGAHPKNWKVMQATALKNLLGKVIEAAWVDKVESVKALKGFLQEQDNAQDTDELKLKASSSSESGESILEALEEMKEKAEETLSGARQTEMKGNHNHQMLTQSLTDARDAAKQRASDAASLKASLTQASGKAKGEMELTQKTKMADMTFLSTLKQECESAAKGWSEKQAAAKAEMGAIEKAKSILADRVKVFFVQTAANDPFDDSSGDDDKKAAVRAKLVDVMKVLSHKMGSYAMMELASAAATDPFEKVKGLISDMVAKLVSEANEEATQKAFCDEEQAKSKKEQAEKSMRTDELNSRIDSAATTKDKLNQQIKDLQQEVAEMDAGNSEATKLRAAEHATYLKSSSDFKGAAQAVEDAIRVLKEYYEGAAFLQAGSTQPKSDAAATIVGILETSGAEFTKMYMQVETSETESVAAFKKMQDENKVVRATKVSSVAGAESEIKSLDVALANNGEDLRMVTKEMDAVMSYIDKLRPQCEQKAMTYQEKVAKRNAEIDGLKEALTIITGPELLQISGLRGAKRH